MRELKIGVSGLGVLHTDASVPDTETKFRMVKASGAFDYIDRTPPRADLENHLKASAKYDLPTIAGGLFYMVGRDESLLEDNLRIGKECGSDVHNVQIFTKDSSGNVLSDGDIADVYMRTYELGDKIGIRPASKITLTCGRSIQRASSAWQESPRKRRRIQHDDGSLSRRYEDGQSEGI